MKKKLLRTSLFFLAIIFVSSCKKESILVDKKIVKISIHDENNKPSDEYETTYTYDSQNRLIRTDDFRNNLPSGDFNIYDYSEVGKVKETRFIKYSNTQQRILYELNSKNYLYKTYFTNVINNFTVDTSKYDFIQYYDSNSRIVQNQFPIKKDTFRTFSFSYDDNGNNAQSEYIEVFFNGKISGVSSYASEFNLSIKNTVDYNYQGLDFFGKTNVNPCTKQILTSTGIENGITKISKVVTENSYELDSDGYISKKITTNTSQLYGSNNKTVTTRTTTYQYN